MLTLGVLGSRPETRLSPSSIRAQALRLAVPSAYIQLRQQTSLPRDTVKVTHAVVARDDADFIFPGHQVGRHIQDIILKMFRPASARPITNPCAVDNKAIKAVGRDPQGG